MKINEIVFFAKISINTLISGTSVFFLLKTVLIHLYQVQKLKIKKNCSISNIFNL